MNQRRIELGLRSETIRRANLSAIVRALHGEGPLSRSELGARTKLTRSAIRVLIGELSSAGLVEEVSGSPVGTPGRPSALVRLRPQRAVVLALEISVDSIAAAIVGIGGEVLHSKRLERSRAQVAIDDTVRDLASLARGLGQRGRPVNGDEELVGIAVAVAGIVRTSDGVVAMAPNLAWRDVPLGQLLRDELGTSHTILVGNEADLGALAEHRRGAAAGFAHVLFVDGEVGVGGGLIVDGQPFAGATGYGGEVGHMPVNPDGDPCGCGSFGCWETEVGERALLARAGHPPDGGPDAVERVLAEARDGEPLACAALDHMGTWLGRGLAGLVNVLNPRVVVLGGLFELLYSVVEQPLRQEFDRLTLRPSASVVTIVSASLGVDAPLLGAAELAFEGLLDDPASLAETGAQREWRVVA